MIKKDEILSGIPESYELTQEYSLGAEPDASHREAAWRIAFGLLALDNVQPSEFLIAVANQNIEGEISAMEALKITEANYDSVRKNSSEYAQARADILAARINIEVQAQKFDFSIEGILNLHFRLFYDVDKNAGQVRETAVSRKE